MGDAIDDDPLALAGRLTSALAGYGATDICVTGSTALGVWATPRQSRDLDVCARVPAAAVTRILARFDGIADGTPETATVLRLSFLRWDVDVFVMVADDAYESICGARGRDAAAPPVTFPNR